MCNAHRDDRETFIRDLSRCQTKCFQVSKVLQVDDSIVIECGRLNRQLLKLREHLQTRLASSFFHIYASALNLERLQVNKNFQRRNIELLFKALDIQRRQTPAIYEFLNAPDIPAY